MERLEEGNLSVWPANTSATKLTLPPRETVLRKVIYDSQTQERLISGHVRALCELNLLDEKVGRAQVQTSDQDYLGRTHTEP